MQDNWLNTNVDEIRKYADRYDNKAILRRAESRIWTTIFRIVHSTQLRWINTPDRQESGPVEMGKRIDQTAHINEESVRLPQVPTKQELGNCLTAAEGGEAIKWMSLGKVPGSDTIPAEVYKSGGPTMVSRLTRLFQCDKEQLNQRLCDATSVHIYKQKGNHPSCKDHRTR